MNTLPNLSHLLKGGIVLIVPDMSAVQRIIVLQYNPHALMRTLQVDAVLWKEDLVENEQSKPNFDRTGKQCH